MTTTLHREFILTEERQTQTLWAFLRANWRTLADQNKPLAVTVERHTSRRSIEQNRQYWAMLAHLAATAWVDGRQFGAEAYHELFKRRFIGTLPLPDGTTTGRSTADLNVAEFANYLERIETYAQHELGVARPL